jgi:uncharacterized protein YuzE
MEKFSFDYDLENDDLFVYLEGKKSSGAVELGNFILDFDKDGNLVAMQILNVSEIFNRFLSKVIEISKLKQVQVEMINFRNMEAIKFKLITDNHQETANIFIPHIKGKSPVLEY